MIHMDVTRDDHVMSGYQKVQEVLAEKQLTLHAVINNAGVAFGGEIEWAPVGSIQDYQKMFDVNFFGVLRVSRMFLPLLRKSKGRLVNLASIMSRTNFIGLNAYCASKAATSKLTEGLQTELAKFGVTAVGVEPWFYKTPSCGQRDPRGQEGLDIVLR